MERPVPIPVSKITSNTTVTVLCDALGRIPNRLTVIRNYCHGECGQRIRIEPPCLMQVVTKSKIRPFWQELVER